MENPTIEALYQAYKKYGDIPKELVPTDLYFVLGEILRRKVDGYDSYQFNRLPPNSLSILRELGVDIQGDFPLRMRF
jgi:hypothetical protein